MGWVAVLGLMLIPGAIGGVIDVLQLINLKKLLSDPDYTPFGLWRRFWGAITVGMLSGAGGAAAVLFLGVWTNQLDTSKSDTRAYVLLATLGVVSGFLGYKALKRVADNIDKRFEDVHAELENAKKEIKEAEARAIEESALIDKCISAWRNEDTPSSEIESLAKRLEVVQARRRSDRTVGIVLCNLYDRLKNHEKAISMITTVIALKTKEAPNNNADIGDLFFNRACYRMPLFVAATAADKADIVDRLKGFIISDLKRSIELNPANRDIASGDDDLAPLRTLPEFNALLRA